jgi:hypothetical protein
MKNTLPKNA